MNTNTPSSKQIKNSKQILTLTSSMTMHVIHLAHSGGSIGWGLTLDFLQIWINICYENVVVLTDLKKLLIPKLLQIGLRESLIPWICIFISDRECVRYNQTLSDYKKLNRGLPKVLNWDHWVSKLLLMMLHQTLLQKCGNTLMAWPWLPTLLNLLQIPSKVSCTNIVSWSKNNNLTLNPSKCPGLQVCFMQDPPTPTLCIVDVLLDFKKFAKKEIGSWLQDDLKWE